MRIDRIDAAVLGKVVSRIGTSVPAAIFGRAMKSGTTGYADARFRRAHGGKRAVDLDRPADRHAETGAVRLDKAPVAVGAAVGVDDAGMPGKFGRMVDRSGFFRETRARRRSGPGNRRACGRSASNPRACVMRIATSKPSSTRSTKRSSETISSDSSGWSLPKSISDWPISASTKVRGAEMRKRPLRSELLARTRSARLSISLRISEAVR